MYNLSDKKKPYQTTVGQQTGLTFHRYCSKINRKLKTVHTVELKLSP